MEKILILNLFILIFLGVIVNPVNGILIERETKIPGGNVEQNEPSFLKQKNVSYDFREKGEGEEVAFGESIKKFIINLDKPVLWQNAILGVSFLSTVLQIEPAIDILTGIAKNPDVNDEKAMFAIFRLNEIDALESIAIDSDVSDGRAILAIYKLSEAGFSLSSKVEISKQAVDALENIAIDSDVSDRRAMEAISKLGLVGFSSKVEIDKQVVDALGNIAEYRGISDERKKAANFEIKNLHQR